MGEAIRFGCTEQIENLRYGRVQLCATVAVPICAANALDENYFSLRAEKIERALGAK